MASAMLPPESPTINLERYATAKEVPYKRDEDAEEGAGSNTIVYRATVRGTDEAVAIKKINCVQQGNTGSSHVLEGKVHSEISMLRQCNHPNLVKFIAAYTVEKLPNNYFIVMQPWAPITLNSLVLSVTSPGKSSFQRIFHKDVKPENILFDNNITPIIADFGVSKLYKPKGLTNYTDSTYQHLAPEQVHHKESSPKSDVFAMGTCFLLLFIAVTEGIQELSLLFKTVYNNSCRFASELPGIFSALQTHLKSLKYGKVKILGFLVRDMLVANPDMRPAASSAKKILDEICGERITGRSLATSLGATATLLDYLDSTEIFNDSKISLLSTEIIDKNKESPYRWRVRILQSADSSTGIPTVLSFDSGSDVNLISSELMQDLRIGGFRLDEKTPATTLDLHVLGERSFVLKQQVTLTLQREYDATQTDENLLTFRETFFVLQGQEAFFSLLLGNEGLRRLGDTIWAPNLISGADEAIIN